MGQVELDIVKTADTTIVVLSPESGDSVQAMKAGLMEIGDIFVLNKCDREGSDRAYIEIETALTHRPSGEWKPPIVKTSVQSREGLENLHQAIISHQEFLFTDGRIDTKHYDRRTSKIRRLVESTILHKYWNEDKLRKLEELSGQNISTISAAKMLMENN